MPTQDPQEWPPGPQRDDDAPPVILMMDEVPALVSRADVPATDGYTFDDTSVRQFCDALNAIIAARRQHLAGDPEVDQP